MCSPSSNADHLGSIGFDGENSPSHANLPAAEQFILHHAALLGPCAAWFIRTLWAQAAQHAYQDSLQLLDYAHRYTPQRLENACERALLYRLEGLAALRFIFAENLDRLPPRPDAELTGQLLFPFANS
jgi:hypothetical protein